MKVKNINKQKKYREYLVKIMGLAYDISERTQTDVWVNWSGHVGLIDVDIMYDGYRENAEVDEKYSIYVGDDDENPEPELKKVMQKLKSLLVNAPSNAGSVATDSK